MKTVIQYQNVSKCFRLSHDRPRSLQESFVRFLTLRRQREEAGEFWALKNVSFAIEQGQTVGLIGTNGSGKSTALKLMAGILRPTSGEITIRGRISALLELGSGMHPDLTGRENIFLNGSMLGLSNGEIRALFPKIVAFSQLSRFIDMPVKHYSSGMYMRLGFSVAIHAQPDILLLDEVLSVGDQSFQNKCLDRIYDMKKRGTTIVMVSHSLEAVRDMCDEMIWLKDGELAEQGRASDVLKSYLYHVHETSTQEQEQESVATESVPAQQRWGSGEIEITAVRLRKGEGDYVESFLTGDALSIEIDYRAREPVEDPVFGLAIHRADGTHINGPNTKLAGMRLGWVSGEGTVTYTIPDLPLMPGTYEISVSAYDNDCVHPYDVHWAAYPFHVNAGGTEEMYGLVRIPAEWRHDRMERPTTEVEPLWQAR